MIELDTTNFANCFVCGDCDALFLKNCRFFRVRHRAARVRYNICPSCTYATEVETKPLLDTLSYMQQQGYPNGTSCHSCPSFGKCVTMTLKDWGE